MIRHIIPLIILGLTIAPNSSAEEPPWPQANGPFGNFTPRQYGVKLLEDTSKAKQVWLSEDTDLGYAKGSASGYLQNLARWPGHPGSCSGPIVAEGKLFVTTFRPAGEPWAENLPQYQRHDNTKAKKPFTKEELARMRQNLRILADDLTVAIDLETGKTVWKAIEEGKGLNRYMGKRQGFCVSPAYHKGTVFSMGTTGLLYAYSAETGKKIWETGIGPAHEKALEHRTKVLEKKTLPGGMGWDVSLVIAEGVLMVPMFDGVDVSLRGVDTQTGRKLWELPNVCSRHATPGVWTHKDKQYVVTATVSGRLHLIEPTKGKILWTVDGLGENHFSLTPTKEHVFVNGGSKTLRKPGDDRRYGLLAAYALTPEKATLTWKHTEDPDLFFPTWMDSCARRFLAVRDGRVYYRSHGKDKTAQRFLILEETTGKVLAGFPLPSPALQYYPTEDRLLAIRDASHRKTRFAFITTKETDFRQLTDFWDPPHEQTSAYEVHMEHPVVAGRIYLRTKDGRIACYDLRKYPPWRDPNMKTFRWILSALLCLIVVPFSFADDADEKDFVKLFDGKTLEGWHLMNNAKFVAEDGVIKLNGGRGWLRSDKEYADFILRLELRFMKPKQDGGVFLRASKEGKGWPSKRYEVQSENSKRMAKIFGAKYKLDVEKAQKVLKPVGEWNEYEIKLVGSNVEVRLNGELVTTSDGLSKLTKGYVGLQGEGGFHEYRNVRIKNLSK